MIYKDFEVIHNNEVFCFTTVSSNVYNGDELILDTISKFNSFKDECVNTSCIHFIINKNNISFTLTDSAINEENVKSVFLNGLIVKVDNYNVISNSIVVNCYVEVGDIITVITVGEIINEHSLINKYNNNVNEKIYLNNIINNFNNVVKVMKEVD